MNRQDMKAYGAFAVVCIVWGTTYLAMRIGVKTIPAFLFSGIRQIVAGAILFGILWKKIKITRREIFHQCVAGILLIGLGNGVIGWTVRYIPSGLASLIFSIMPLYVVLISYVTGLDRKPLNSYIISGLLLGCTGIALIFRDNLGDLARPEYFMGILVAFFASFCWAAGSIYTKHTTPANTNVFVNAAIQISCGGVVLMGGSFFFDDFSQLHIISGASIWALVYLIIFGSLISYACFLYALEKLPAGLASIYAYINPLIAILLGYLVLAEKITWITGLAFITTIGGVYLVNRGYVLQKARQLPVEET